MVDILKEYEIDDDELTKIIKPSLREMYAILLQPGIPFICEIKDINYNDHILIAEDIQTNKEYLFVIDGDLLVMKSDISKYEIIDIERVVPFDLKLLTNDHEQLKKQFTSDIIQDLDISLDDIVTNDIIYTTIELKEDIMSQLIKSFNAYDSYKLIKSINKSVDNIFNLISQDEQVYLYNIHFEETLPKWLVPIIDNPLLLDPDITPIDKDITSYNQLIVQMLDTSRPILNSLSDVGYSSNTYVSSYFRDCLSNETCMGVKGNYKYDMRRNKSSYTSIFDSTKHIIHSPDYLNITGLLYIPDNKLNHAINLHTNKLTISEKCLLDSMKQDYSSYTLKYSPMIQKNIDQSLIITDLDQIIMYSIPERIETSDEFIQVLQQITPSIENILSSIDENITNKLLNYKDIQSICIKYDINLNKLSKSDILYTNKLINDNVTTYLNTHPSLKHITIKESTQELNIYQKIQLSLDVILSMNDIPAKNEYLTKFIDIFTREPYSKQENKSWLYNSYTNQPILCKHYLYSSVYHNDKQAYESMVSIYGKHPVDGSIYCKNCGEYLCQEDYSAFDGFSNEQPILLREEINKDINLLDNVKDEDISFIKQISHCLGTTISDKDIKLISDTYTSFNNDIMANTRYNSKDITTSDEHPRVQSILTKYSKENKKKELISKDIKKFQTYLKYTNKIIGFLSLLIIVVYSSIPAYNFKNSNYTFISFSHSLSIESIVYNKEVLDYCIYKINKLSQNYPTDKYWSEYKLLTQEHKLYGLPDIKQQLLNIIHYTVSPIYPLFQERLISYGTFIQSSSNLYINFEWPLFKPLYKSEVSTNVTDVLLSIHDQTKENYILNYNEYPVENISMITPINNNENKYIYKQLNIDVSEILVNQGFLRLFTLAVSNYGTSKQIIPSIDLHIENFLQTIKDKDKILDIFTKYGWKSSRLHGFISYKDLRTKIIPDIITYYLKLNLDISTCYSNETICNQFIHTNVNNYDLHLLKTPTKRFYEYKLNTIYPDKSFSDISDEFKDKIFSNYCKDPSGNIIKKFITTNYLGKYLLNTHNVFEPTYTTTYEQPLHIDESNFKGILKQIQQGLPLYLYSKPKQLTIDDYNIDIYRIHTNQEYKLLQLFKSNNLFDLTDEHPIINSLTNITEYDNINHDTVTSIVRELNTSFSQLPFDELKYIISESISSILSDPDNTKQRKRFENIFINTSSNINISQQDRSLLETDGFTYKNMRESDIIKVFELFMDSDKLNETTIKQYIYSIRHTLAKLSYHNNISSYIPKFWGLSEYNKDVYKHYIKHNSFLLHQDIFKRDPLYKGFFNYDKPTLFITLIEYLEPYLQDIHTLKINNKLINKTIEYITSKFILFFIIKKIIEFYNLLKNEDDDIISSIDTHLHNTNEEFNLLEYIDILERFIIDLLTNILETHYDSRWIISNDDHNNLKQRLSKQQEKEKQQLIVNLESMSNEKRSSNTELQKIGAISMYHESIESNEKRIIDEYSTIDEGDDEYSEKNIIDASMNIQTGEMNVRQQPTYNNIEVGEGYYDENDIDEEGEVVSL